MRLAQNDVVAVRWIEAFVPQEHALGAEAEVDYGVFCVVFDGVNAKCRLFVVNRPRSDDGVIRVWKMQSRPRRTPEEIKRRASRLVLDHPDEYPALMRPVSAPATAWGPARNSLRRSGSVSPDRYRRTLGSALQADGAHQAAEGGRTASCARPARPCLRGTPTRTGQITAVVDALMTPGLPRTHGALGVRGSLERCEPPTSPPRSA